MSYYYLYSNLPKPLSKVITDDSVLILKLKTDFLPLKDFSFVHVYYRDKDKFFYKKIEII